MMAKENPILKSFDDYLLSMNTSRTTRTTYKSTVRQFHLIIGKVDSKYKLPIDPESITVKDVELYIRDIKSRIATHSQRHMLYGLKRYLKYLKKEYENTTIDYFTKLAKDDQENPLKPGRGVNVRVSEPLTKDEIQRIFDVSKVCPRDYAMLKTFYYTVQRKGSICNLNVSDINFDTNEVSIHAKGNQIYTVYIDNDALQSIKDYLLVREEPDEGFITDNYGRKLFHKDALFLNGTGRRLSLPAVYTMVKKYSVLAKIEKRCFPHCFRHTGISMMHDAGMGDKSIQMQSGHRSNVALQRYIHPNKKIVKDKVFDILSLDNEKPKQPVKKPTIPVDPNIKKDPDPMVAKPQDDKTDRLISLLEKGLIDKTEFMQLMTTIEKRHDTSYYQ
jgi:site-specific recombinase XerD